jgi:hypothetical protein
MSDVIDMRPLGLRLTDRRLLRTAVWAWSQVPNGNYLVGHKREVFAAERLIDRGFLTRAEKQPAPPVPDWLVIVMTPDNHAALRREAEVRAAACPQWPLIVADAP